MFLGKDTEAQITLIHPSVCVWVWSLEHADRHSIKHCFEFSLGVKMRYISQSFYHLIIKWRKPEKVLYSLIFPFPKMEVSVRFSTSVLQPWACRAKTDPQPKHWVLLHLTEATTVTSSNCPAVTIFCTYKLSMKVNDKQWFNDAVPLHYLIVCLVGVEWDRVIWSGNPSCAISMKTLKIHQKHIWDNFIF